MRNSGVQFSGAYIQKIEEIKQVKACFLLSWKGFKELVSDQVREDIDNEFSSLLLTGVFVKAPEKLLFQAYIFEVMFLLAPLYTKN